MIHKSVILALGCLLLGFGAGMVSRPPVLEPSEPLAPPATVKGFSSGQTGYAHTACIGHQISNSSGGWSVVFEPGEC